MQYVRIDALSAACIAYGGTLTAVLLDFGHAPQTALLPAVVILIGIGRLQQAP